MYGTKMIKVYFPGWQLWTCSLIVNLLVLASPPSSSLAQNDPNSANLVSPQASAEKAKIADLEPEILSEINRVRTSPQSYAQWLEQQRQYYDGIWLKLPGEKPIRTNRGKQALEEAIVFLKQQPPLPPLASSEATDAAATAELANFANTNNIQFFSYGKKTAAGIVMDLVVDELFPDRRRRQSLLSSEAEDTGVVCKPDPRYAKVCAIAYSDSPLTREVAEVKPETPTTSTTAATSNETVAKSPTVNPTAEPPSEPAVSEPKAETTPATTATPNETAAKLPEVNPSAEPPTEPPAEPATEPQVETPTATPATPDETVAKSPEVDPPTPAQEPAATPESKDNLENESVASLPVPPQPQTPPTNTEVEEPQTSQETKAKTEEELEIAQAESEIAQIEQEQEKIAENEEASDQPTEVEAKEEEAAAPEESQSVAINTEAEDFSEQVEEGKLEQGDRVIADDGSLYDYYPMQGQAGESLIIHLESDEFDAFVALVDSNGKTVGENDDISQEDSNSELKVTLPEDGVYNVIVNTYDEKGIGNYVLKVSR